MSGLHFMYVPVHRSTKKIYNPARLTLIYDMLPNLSGAVTPDNNFLVVPAGALNILPKISRKKKRARIPSPGNIGITINHSTTGQSVYIFFCSFPLFVMVEK